jgi:hypothetical protein
MDLSYGAEYERFRAQVRTFLAENWDIGRTGDRDYVAQFRRAATSAGRA